MGVQVITSGDDSETCHTLYPRYDRNLSTSLAVEQTISRFVNRQLCKCGYSLLSKFAPENLLGVSKRHRKARWMQRQSLFGPLVGLFCSMNAAMGWNPLKNNLSSGAKK
ncbi:hypothetical protein TNCV_4406081 [Trichonephila clavipes]|nr:hypothetical protein TNCV_4406081 [Trichonephila clavipes]